MITKLTFFSPNQHSDILKNVGMLSNYLNMDNSNQMGNIIHDRELYFPFDIFVDTTKKGLRANSKIIFGHTF